MHIRESATHTCVCWPSVWHITSVYQSKIESWCGDEPTMGQLGCLESQQYQKDRIGGWEIAQELKCLPLMIGDWCLVPRAPVNAQCKRLV